MLSAAKLALAEKALISMPHSPFPQKILSQMQQKISEYAEAFQSWQ